MPENPKVPREGETWFTETTVSWSSSGVDINLTTDMLTHSFKNNDDIVIIVSEDGDYTGDLQAVKDNGKNVEVALFGKESTSVPLREVADRVVCVDGRFRRGCWK